MPTKLKSRAEVYTPQTRDDCAGDIRKLGDLQRELTRAEADMNDAIAAITAQHQPRIEAMKAQLDTLRQGVQTWCEAHRDELTEGGKTKTANLITGEVSWRIRPPSVSVRGADAVIDALRRLGLGRFVRTRDEVNKEAILNEPEAVRGVAGIAIVTGVEDFAIAPFEQEAL